MNIIDRRIIRFKYVRVNYVDILLVRVITIQVHCKLQFRSFTIESTLEVSTLISEDDVGVSERVDKLLKEKCDRRFLLIRNRICFHPFCFLIQ